MMLLVVCFCFKNYCLMFECLHSSLSKLFQIEKKIEVALFDFFAANTLFIFLK